MEMYSNPLPGQGLRKVDDWHSGYQLYEELIESDIHRAQIVTSEVRKHRKDDPEFGKYGIEVELNRGNMAWYPRTHKPVLDIDMPVKIFPSSTEGHFHLFIDKEMSWEDYCKLMNVMAEVGILEQGYVNASIARGCSAVRLPWIKKEGLEEVKKNMSERERW